jgi:hypothetical protein
LLLGGLGLAGEDLPSSGAAEASCGRSSLLGLGLGGFGVLAARPATFDECSFVSSWVKLCYVFLQGLEDVVERLAETPLVDRFSEDAEAFPGSFAEATGAASSESTSR